MFHANKEYAMTPAQRAKRICLAEAENPEALITGEIHEALRELLDRIGLPCICKACGRAVWFVRHHQSGQLRSFDATGMAHLITCPKAAELRKDPRNGKPVKPPPMGNAQRE